METLFYEGSGEDSRSFYIQPSPMSFGDDCVRKETWYLTSTETILLIRDVKERRDE